jgi:hypothetical protein
MDGPIKVFTLTLEREEPLKTAYNGIASDLEIFPLEM